MVSEELWHENFPEEGNGLQDTPSAPQTIFECNQTILPTFSSDNRNQNATPNPLISNGTNIQEVNDLTSNAVINYIGQILLEEDIDDEISIYQEETAIRETEKSFYDLLGKEHPLSPTLIEFHPPQNYNTTNSGSSNTIESVSENDVPLYSNYEPLFISVDRTSTLFMENVSTTKVQKGADEAMKFLLAVEKLFVGLEPNRIEFPENPKKIYVSENKTICLEASAKKCARKDREPDPSEGRMGKQQAVSSDEPAKK